MEKITIYKNTKIMKKLIVVLFSLIPFVAYPQYHKVHKGRIFEIGVNQDKNYHDLSESDVGLTVKENVIKIDNQFNSVFTLERKEKENKTMVLYKAIDEENIKCDIYILRGVFANMLVVEYKNIILEYIYFNNDFK